MSRKLYGAEAEQVVTSVTGVIRPDGAGNVTAFDGDVFLAAMQSQLDPNKTLKYIRVIKYNYTTYWNFVLDYYYTDMSSFNLVNHGSAADVAAYGVTVTDTLGSGQDLIDLTQTVGPSGRYLTAQVNKLYGGVNGEATEATKMYGSLNGQTKLVYQSFDHARYTKEKYGNIVYYTGTTTGYGAGPNSYNIYVYNMDQQGAASFILDNNVKVTDHAATLWFDSSNYAWAYETNDGVWQRINLSTMRSQYNIDVEPTNYNDARFDLADNAVIGVDTTSPTATASLTSLAQYNDLGNSTNDGLKQVTVGSVSMIIGQIKEITTGYLADATPNYFLRYSSVDTADLSYSPITQIGTYFLANTPLTSLSLSDSQRTIGSSFLYGCSSFNQPLDVSNATSIGGAFLQSCSSFNQPLTFDPAASLNMASFLGECHAFNQNLVFPENLVYSSGGYCMRNCKSMTSTITWNYPISFKEDNTYFTTSDTTCAYFTTGVTFDGPYSGCAARLYPSDSTSLSLYRKTNCADAVEDYGVVYHYGYTATWVDAGWIQNVTWAITDQTIFDSFVQNNGGVANAQFNFWYDNNTWNVWVQNTGQQRQIANMQQEVGITVTSTGGGFQQGDGWSMRDYISTDTSTGLLRTVLTSTADFNKLYSNAGNSVWSLNNGIVYSDAVVSVVVGDTITSTPSRFLALCPRLKSVAMSDSLTTIGNDNMYSSKPVNAMYLRYVTSIGTLFMANNSAFNSVVNIPRIVTIGNGFLMSCTLFNTSISLPSTCTTIGNSFLSGCTSFNKAITLPSSLTSIGTNLLYNCDSMTLAVTASCAATVASTSDNTFATTNSSAACYTTGIRISGSYKNNWISRFPNRTSSPYRKLRT